MRILLVQTQLDAVASETVLTTITSTFNCFNAILDDVRQRLGKLSTVAHHAELALRRVEHEADRRVRDFVQEQGLAGDLMDVLVAEHRLGHPREVGEFVDHSAQVSDLADDGRGEPLERLLVG